jgi:cell wall-associated NlpC family hydrolase
MRLFCKIIIISLLFTAASCNLRKHSATHDKTNKDNLTDNTNDRRYTAIKKKYAEELGVSDNNLINGALYEFIDDWIGVPYKYAGNDKNGVDCSGFVNALYKAVFNKQLSRSATDIVKECNIIEKDKLQEGDLVFFDISAKNSHVGVYLVNNKFIHASTSKGVIISDLTQAYYVKYWGRAGRLK